MKQPLLMGAWQCWRYVQNLYEIISACLYYGVMDGNPQCLWHHANSVCTIRLYTKNWTLKYWTQIIFFLDKPARLIFVKVNQNNCECWDGNAVDSFLAQRFNKDFILNTHFCQFFCSFNSFGLPGTPFKSFKDLKI